MAERSGLHAVERLQVHRDPLCDEPTQQVQQRRHVTLVRAQGGLSDVRPALEDASDHARARGARPHLQEEADALLVCSLDELREVEAAHRLLENAVGRALAGHLVDVSGCGAEKAHSSGSRRREEVEVVVLFGHGFGHGAVHRGHAFQRVEVAVQGVHHRGDAFAVASDDAFGRCVDDKQVDALLGVQYATHRRGCSIDHAGDPVHFLELSQTPTLADAVAVARQIVGEERALHESSEHHFSVSPGA